MVRLSLIGIAMNCIWMAGTYAQQPDGQPPQDLVVAFDVATAQLLPPQVVLGVLVHDKCEADEIINERALAMRHATHFAYQSGHESSLVAMYRERLQSQGVIAIELPRQNKRERNIAPGNAVAAMLAYSYNVHHLYVAGAASFLHARLGVFGLCVH